MDYPFTQYHEVHTAYSLAAILVDGRQAVTFSGAEMYEQEMYGDGPAHQRHVDHDAAFCKAELINVLTAYRHISIGNALDHEDFIIRVLAILDRRPGKRTLQRIIQQDAWNGWPEWVRRFCILRFDAKELPYPDAPRPYPHPPATLPRFSRAVHRAFTTGTPKKITTRQTGGFHKG